MFKVQSRFLVISICVLSFLPFLYSQDIKFTHIGSDQGLSQASVNCILQDRRGFMWFGTQDGLNRYDGYSNDMVVYKQDHADSNSISNNYIECLYEDKSGVIWVGTRNGGLNAFNPALNQFTHFKNDPKNNKSLNGNQVKCIFQDSYGLYWVGTTAGLNTFNGKENSFIKYEYNPDDSLTIKGLRVESVYEDSRRNLWVCTLDGGINLFNREKKTFTYYPDRVIDDKGAEHYNHAKIIVEDASGLFFIATDNGGISVFNPRTKIFIRHITHSSVKDNKDIPENRITALCFNNTKTALWAGSKNNGLVRLNEDGKQISKCRFNEYDSQSLSADGINCIYKDKQENIWIGTEGGGVSVYFPNTIKFNYYHKDAWNEKQFQSNAVFGLLQDRDGLIWVATMHGGITTIDRANNIYNNYGYINNNSLSSSKSNSVLSLFEDKDGLIWVGTWGGGVNAFDKNTGVVSRIMQKGTITCIVQGQANLIWIGSFGGSGLYSYDKSSGNLIAYSSKKGLMTNMVLCLYDDGNSIWIGTSGEGLNSIDYKLDKLILYKHDEHINSISDNTVNCIYDDHKGNLWIGTSNGLNKFNVKTKFFTAYTEKDGLPNGNIWGILCDKNGNLWISTNKGISKFNPHAGKHGLLFKNFTKQDGLQGNEFAQGSYFINERSGEMFFGGLNGFNSFNPDNVLDNKHIPPIYITSFKKQGKEVNLDSSITAKKHITLSYKDNFISFEFVGLDYVSPEKIKYSYKMDGLDANWSPVSNRRYAGYTSLPGGEYVFRLRASNSDGIWNNQGAAIYITVNPPWWKTNTFYSLCILSSVALVFGFIRYRTARVERKNKILERKIELRTIELAEKNKDITSSIKYAQRIQQAILPTREQAHQLFPESFVLYKPKDIVSGDFYWCGERNGRSIVACVDCTGHGVPGAFMSMIGANLLNQIILEKGIIEPAAILSALNKGVRTALKQGKQSGVETKDGMDIALCSIDKSRREVQFASAFRHLVIISDGKLEKISGDKISIGGGMQIGDELNFTNHINFLNKGDMLYMFSDGYADQFGGDKGKKLMVKKLHESLQAVSNSSIADQRTLLDKNFEEWRGSYDQVDDVLLIGIRM